jgi:uroporphyrin-III C-methyltransferase/precorrin-2 dehydrogenase/sirohydrochlorin ferrochelatase
MGLKSVEHICQCLREHGMSMDMPAALVEQGTLAGQRIHVGTIGELPRQLEGAGARSPALLIVGEVVRLHPRLMWFRPDRP